MHVHCQIRDKIGPILTIMLDKITLNGERCSMLYKIIQQASENVIIVIGLKRE